MIGWEFLKAQEALWGSLTDQALDLFQRGSYDEAIQTAQKALEVAQSIFGPQHFNLSTSLNNLAALYSVVGRASDAEQLFLQERSVNLDGMSRHRDTANGPLRETAAKPVSANDTPT